MTSSVLFRIFSHINKSLFIGSLSTGLARFKRSHLTATSFAKLFMCSYEKVDYSGYRAEKFPISMLMRSYRNEEKMSY